MASGRRQDEVPLTQSVSSQMTELSINVRHEDTKVTSDTVENTPGAEDNILSIDISSRATSPSASSPPESESMSSPDDMQIGNRTGSQPVSIPTRGKHSESTLSEDVSLQELDVTEETKENISYEDILRKLYHAIDEGSHEIVQDVVHKYNIDVNVVFTGNLPFIKRKHEGWAAIHIAASHGNTKAIRFLLAGGSDIEAVTSKGETALHIAAKNGAADVVSYLLDCNVYLRDRQNDQGVTALLKVIVNSQHAFKGNYRRCADLLLGCGCNPNISSSSKVTALHVAVDKGDLHLVTALINAGANVNAVCDRNTSPLLRALKAKFVHMQIVSALLQAGADTSFKINGRSALHIAVSRCDERIIETFLHHSTDINCKDLSGKTPLWVAVEENNTKVVPILVAGGADINYVREPQCISLLSQAVLNNSLPMVQLLLKLGASSHTETFMWSTPLHFAVDLQNIDIIKELLRANCQLNSTSNAKYALRPMTPLQLAMDLGNVEIMCLLLQCGCKIKSSWLTDGRISAALANKPDAVKHLHKFLSQIPSLLHLSRVCIREYLGDRFRNALEHITEGGVIPRKISDYIALTDILS